VRHEAWGWEGHVDARWRLCRRAAFNGSVARFKLVVSVVGYLFASLCLLFPFVCLMVCWWCRLDLKLYVNAAPLVREGGSNCVSFACVLFVTADSIGFMVDASILLCLEGICPVSVSFCRVLIVLARFVMFCSRLWSTSSLPPAL